MLKIRHKSDCSLHNPPAYEAKPCDCGVEKSLLDALEMLIKRGDSLCEVLKVTSGEISIARSDFKTWLEIIKTHTFIEN